MTLSTAAEIARRAYYGTLKPWMLGAPVRQARRIMAGQQQPFPPPRRRRVVIIQSAINDLNRTQAA